MGGEELKSGNNPAELVVPLAWLENLIRESERQRQKYDTDQLTSDMAEAFTQIDALNKKIDGVLDILTEHKKIVNDLKAWVGERKAALEDENKRPPLPKSSEKPDPAAEKQQKKPGRKPQLKPKKSTRNGVDLGKIRALADADWPVEEIAAEMHLSEGEVMQYLDRMEDLV